MEPQTKKQKTEDMVKPKVELRFTIPNDAEQQAFITWLKSRKGASATSNNEECYLIGPHTEPALNKNNIQDSQNIVQLRSENDADFITMQQNTTSSNANEKTETYVEDGRVLKDIFVRLGYKTLTLRKKCEIKQFWHKLRCFEVTFDQMKEDSLENRLFVHIELKSDVVTRDDEKNGIKWLLKTAGLKKVITYNLTYLQMMLNPEIKGEELNLV